MTNDPSEGFLGRWSRAKRAAAKSVLDPEPEDTAPELSPVADDAPETPSLSEEELAALPRIEDLTEGSDIRAFLRAGVPRVLRNAAMRKIWMLTPAIRDYRDPAVDYAWDWNTPGGVPGDGVAPSAERAGEMLRQLLAPRQDTPPETTTEQAAAIPEMAESLPVSAPRDDDAVAQIDIEESPPPPEPDPAPRRRHGSALPG